MRELTESKSYWPQLQSRTHRLNFQPSKNCQIYIKRDDELSFGVSGTKIRKYSSLIPKLKEENVPGVVAIGGANSNNILGLCQILTEQQVPLKLALKGTDFPEKGVNSHILRSLWPNIEIRWISSDDWASAEQVAQIWAKELGWVLLKEGGLHPWSLPGAESLATDIRRNEKELGIDHFEHIFIDSGTGCSAMGLASGLSKLDFSGELHIVHIAGTVEEFSSNLSEFTDPQLLKSIRISHHIPKTGKSFGSFPSSLRKFIQDFAQSEGVILDPIYSGKLWQEIFDWSLSAEASGKVLGLHSGGAQSLIGFLK